MAEELKERKAFEAHMRVGGHSNHDKHPDGSYVSSAMELWWQGWKARAQLPSQGGEAVAKVSVWQIDPWYAGEPSQAGRNIGVKFLGDHAKTLADGQPLYTHPADQVTDDPTKVKVSRELLELLCEMVDLHNRRGTVLTVHMEHLRALLASLNT